MTVRIYHVRAGCRPRHPVIVLPTWAAVARWRWRANVRLILGGMLLGAWGGASSNDAIQLVREAVDRGFDSFDTASSYGHGESEEILGRALRGRADVSVSTKVWLEPQQSSEQVCRAVDQSIDESRRRLQRDHLDCVAIHRVDDGLPWEAALDALFAAVKDGRIGAIGTSCMSGDLLQQLAVAGGALGCRIRSEQCKYSLLDRVSEATIHPVASEHSIQPIHYGVLEEGLLALRQVTVDAVVRTRAARNVAIHPWPSAAALALERQAEVARRLAQIAASAGISLLELAVGFAAGSGIADWGPRVVVGASRASQVAALASAAEVQLSSDVLDAVDEIVPPGTAVGLPDRSRIRSAVMTRRGVKGPELLVGGPHWASDSADRF